MFKESLGTNFFDSPHPVLFFLECLDIMTILIGPRNTLPQMTLKKNKTFSGPKESLKYEIM